MSPVRFEVKTVHSRELYEDFVKFTYKVKTPMTTFRLCLFASCFLTISYVIWGTTGSYVSGAFGLFLVMFAFLRHKIGASRLIKSNKNFDKKQPVVFEFYEKEFTVDNLDIGSKVLYHEAEELYEDASYYYINVNNELVHIIPKKDFTIGEPEKFREFIEKRCKLSFQPPKKPFKQKYKEALTMQKETDVQKEQKYQERKRKKLEEKNQKK